jgi:hypothetical protein
MLLPPPQIAVQRVKLELPQWFILGPVRTSTAAKIAELREESGPPPGSTHSCPTRSAGKMLGKQRIQPRTRIADGEEEACFWEDVNQMVDEYRSRMRGLHLEIKFSITPPQIILHISARNFVPKH